MELFKDYFATLALEVRERMENISKIVMDEAPEAKPTFKYQMPGFEWNGYLIHFCAFQHHIGLYAIPNQLPEFVDKLRGYKTGKGSMQILHSQPITEELIREMIQFNLAQNNRKKDGSER